MKSIGTYLLPALLCMAPALSFAADKIEPSNTTQASANTSLNSATTGTVQVGTDNTGAPIYMGYKTQGKNDGRPVMVMVDPYFGLQSWTYVQDKFAKDYYTISFDNLGYGTSSKNAPTALDGINGNNGYSYRQQAYFTHQLLNQINPLGSVTFVTVDTQGSMALWYATDYANSSHPITKLMIEDGVYEPVVSDDPCSLAYVTFSTMQAIVGYFQVDRNGALRAILGQNFQTDKSPTAEADMLDLAVAYVSTTTDDIFARTNLGTATEDLTPLIANIQIPVLVTYGLTGDNLALTRRAVGLPFFGNSPGYPNAQIPGTCTTPKPFINGFTQGRFLTYPGHSVMMHLTAFKRFVRDLKEFASGTDSDASVYLP